jgi:hypothetical protein
VLFFEELFETEVMLVVTLENEKWSTDFDGLIVLSMVSIVAEDCLVENDDEEKEESEDISDLVVEESCLVLSEEVETLEADKVRLVL